MARWRILLAMLLVCAEVLVGGGIAFANHGAWHQTLAATQSSSNIHTSPQHEDDPGACGDAEGDAVTATGIIGGILDVTGVGAPLGLALNGISLVTGLGQAGIDCTANLNANCGLELGTAALGAVGLGALGKASSKAITTEKALNDAEDLAKTSKSIEGADKAAKDASALAPVKKTGGAGPVKTGQEGEAYVRAHYDIGKKPTIITINGNGRIPDGINHEAISEVKNVSKLSNTKQLRDYAEMAKKKGLRLDIYVRNRGNTKISGPLRALDKASKSPVNIIEAIPHHNN
jgi:hypothetical protein